MGVSLPLCRFYSYEVRTERRLLIVFLWLSVFCRSHETCHDNRRTPNRVVIYFGKKERGTDPTVCALMWLIWIPFKNSKICLSRGNGSFTIGRVGFPCLHCANCSFWQTIFMLRNWLQSFVNSTSEFDEVSHFSLHN